MTSEQTSRALSAHLGNFDVLALAADELRGAVYIDPEDADNKDPRVDREVLERFKAVLRDLSLVGSGMQPTNGSGVKQWRP